jgi:hypothetical protein
MSASLVEQVWLIESSLLFFNNVTLLIILYHRSDLCVSCLDLLTGKVGHYPVGMFVERVTRRIA